MFAKVAQSGRANFLEYPRDRRWWKPLSGATMALVASVGKLFWMNHKFDIEGEDILQEALRQAKLEKRGVITVMNHISILDDPLVWSGFLGLRQFATPGQMRWVLGARNICFKNKPSSWFFSLGQVLPVDRFGSGPFQPAIDTAVWLTGQSQWVHMFPEGFVHQPYPPFENTQKYFKWGVSRVVLEADKQPIVLPIYGTGLEKVFPEDLPKRTLGYGKGVAANYKVGLPMSTLRIREFRQEWNALCHGKDSNGYVPEALQNGLEACDLRSRTASYLRQEVIKLRRSMGFSDETHDLGQASFWKSNEHIKLKQLKEKDPRKLQ